MSDSPSAPQPLVLIVDDEPELCDLVSMQLEIWGYRVLTAEDGRSAFTLFEQNAPALVISDLRMPNGGGVELLERIRTSQRPATPVILMSGFSDDDTTMAELGATAFLSKPFRLDTLKQTIVACISSATV